MWTPRYGPECEISKLHSGLFLKFDLTRMGCGSLVGKFIYCFLPKYASMKPRQSFGSRKTKKFATDVCFVVFFYHCLWLFSEMAKYFSNSIINEKRTNAIESKVMGFLSSFKLDFIPVSPSKIGKLYERCFCRSFPAWENYRKHCYHPDKYQFK